MLNYLDTITGRELLEHDPPHARTEIRRAARKLIEITKALEPLVRDEIADKMPFRKPFVNRGWQKKSSVAIDRAEIAHQAHIQAGGESIPP